MTGWVKLDRALLNWRYKGRPDYVALWVHILLEANHKPKKWEEIELESGEFVTSVSKLSVDTGLSVQQVRTILKKLEGEELLAKSTNRYTVIKVINWAKYQCEGELVNKQITNEQQTDNKQVTTTKNDKNVKNIRNISNTNVLLAQSDESLKAKYRLPLNVTDTYYLIFQEDIDHYKELYPGVDVDQEIRSMIGWCEANPANRKTKTGAKRFIANWLNKSQNKSHTPVKKKGETLFYAVE